MRRTLLFLSVVALVLSSCGGGTEESKPSASQRPEASAQSSPSADTVTLDMLVGSWTGDVIEFERNEGGEHFDRTIWSTTLTIRDCSAGGRCGHYAQATRRMGWTGEPARCRVNLSYASSSTNYIQVSFEESVVSGPCTAGTTTLTRATGDSLSVVWTWEGAAYAAGLLERVLGS